MSGFITEDFLLKSKAAKALYHEYAASMPIIDYHCHVSPKEIAKDVSFADMAQVWLGADHYKWRLMRAAGVEEHYITGDADGREKFRRFAAVLPLAIGNPLYHWSHLELKNYFGYDGPLNAGTADEVFDLCNEALRRPEMGARGLIGQSNVRFIGTTDDPADSLGWHKQLAGEGYGVTVAPTFRPDKAVNIEKPDFIPYISGLLGPNADLPALKQALLCSMERFAALGCRASDHGMDAIAFAPCSDQQAAAIFQKRLNGDELSLHEVEMYRTNLLLFLGEEIARRGWVMQLHFNVQRNVNKRMFARLGPDTGFDVVDTSNCARSLAAFLNGLDEKDLLPKTIVYSLNGGDNAMIGSVIGAFQGRGKGHVQHGSAWWFNDTKSGMLAQLSSLAETGLLGSFVGMLTDSRSFLSYARHEYFRRILCNLIGGWVEDGEVFADIRALGGLVQDVCYNNAKDYFSL